MNKTSLSEEKNYKNIIFGIILLFIISNFAISATLYFYHISAQKDALFTEISNKSRAIGMSVKNILEHAVSLDIPLEAVRGTPQYLNNKLKQSPELEYLVLTNEKGEILAKTEEVRDSLRGSLIRFAKSINSDDEQPEPFKIYSSYNIPLLIKSKDKVIGYLHVGIAAKIIKNNISSVFYDILVILIASIVIGYEFLSYFFMNSIIHPVREFIKSLQRISSNDFSSVNQIGMHDVFSELLIYINKDIINLNTKFKSLIQRYLSLKSSNAYHDIVGDKVKEVRVHSKWAENEPQEIFLSPIVSNLRLLAFLIIFSEAILIPILPSYAAQFYEPTFYFSKQFTSSLPITFFMLFALLSIPLSPRLSYKFGFRKTFIIGYSLIALGYSMIYIGDGLIPLLLSRSLTAIGFSTSYICFQNYVSAYATTEMKLRSYAIFSVAIGSAYICGAPLGGLLVENIGLKYTFLLAILAAVSAIMITRKYIHDLRTYTLTAERKVTKKSIHLFKIPELLLSVFCSGLPMRLLHSSLVCFLYPLYLQQLGNSQSAVGRTMMVFGIVMFLVAPIAPRFVAKISKSPLVTIIVSFIMGISMMMDQFFHTTEGVIFGLAIYAIGSVIHVSAMMSILEDVFKKVSSEHTQSTILSFYFIFERIGMIFGPVLTSILLAHFSYSKTLFYMGAMILFLNSIYASYLLIGSRQTNKPLVRS